jgi:hypothetical protein
MLKRKRFMGMVFFFMGIGMVFSYLMPAWGYILACMLIVAGFWYVFNTGK